MDPKAVAQLLAAWRGADRRWEATSRDDPGFRAACIDVLRSWLDYHTAVDDHQPGEFALVTDDDRVYVAASPSVALTLGYTPEAMLGRRIEDVAAPNLVAATDDRWSAFLIEGRQDGAFDMVRSDGSIVTMRYQARAHYPIANFHMSRLWPANEPS